MPDEKPESINPAGDAGAESAPKPPQPSYVTREELQAQSSELLARIEGLMQGYAAQVQSHAAPTAPTPEPGFDLNSLNEALSEGRGGAEKIAEYVEQRARQIASKAVADAVDPIRQYGLNNLEQVAKATALNGLPHAKRFEKEVETYMSRVDASLRGSVDAWRNAYALVRGNHADDLEREAVEAAVRRANETRPEPTPGGSNVTLKDDDGGDLPTLESLAGPDGSKVLRDKGINNLGELARRMGYKDEREYLKVAKMVEEFNGDLI